MNALEIKNLSVSFLMYDKGIKKKALKVISDLSISIKPGEIHAVIGSSGSGKSLLAHALLGILPKNAITTGEMNWFGEKAHSRAAKEAPRRADGARSPVRKLS